MIEPPVIEHDKTRRELLRGGVVGMAASTGIALAATCDPPEALAAPVLGDDGAVLVSLLRVEKVLVLAYERALASGTLAPQAHKLVSAFLAHERAHVHALSVHLTDLGITIAVAPTTTAAFESELRHLRVRRSLASLRTQREQLRFLTDLETLSGRHYRYAIAHLGAAKQLTTAAEIMANEAQHATVLREFLSPGNVKRAVPTGFVAGHS
ncbi:MAG TPA: ferritin-like domain-containing protein [Solirubrobacteraceae bacterium]|jgi:hypothetical protein|nr:ferritin-like domain-containing protein [Solirubrobacteraceae bacterium]